jgi:hypothetical protein
MPHSQCPNIKNDILQLRSKIGELVRVKSMLLRDPIYYLDKLTAIRMEIDFLIQDIDKKIDLIANTSTLPEIKKSRIYDYVSYFSEGKIWVRKQRGQCFYMNLRCEKICNETYLQANAYHENKAAVQKSEDVGFHIDRFGKPIYSQKYKKVNDYNLNRAPVRSDNGECFHIDEKGDPAYKQRYESASSYTRDGHAVVKTFAGEFFHIDLDGNRLP